MLLLLTEVLSGIRVGVAMALWSSWMGDKYCRAWRDAVNTQCVRVRIAYWLNAICLSIQGVCVCVCASIINILLNFQTELSRASRASEFNPNECVRAYICVRYVHT